MKHRSKGQTMKQAGNQRNRKQKKKNTVSVDKKKFQNKPIQGEALIGILKADHMTPTEFQSLVTG